MIISLLKAIFWFPILMVIITSLLFEPTNIFYWVLFCIFLFESRKIILPAILICIGIGFLNG